jgi:hypothetical protein
MFSFTLPLLLFGCSMPPLHVAAQNGDTQQIVSLLDQGANINEKFGTDDVTALSFAVRAGQTDAVQVLLARGADPNIGSSGLTPLDRARDYNHLGVVRLLLEYGATVNSETIKMMAHRTHPQIRQLLSDALTGRKPSPLVAPTVPSPSMPSSASASSVLVGTSDVDRLSVRSGTLKKNAYAVVIGIEQYRQQLPTADFAANDAKVMGEYLTKMMGYPEENVVVRLNDKAAKTDLEKYFEEWLQSKVRSGDSVFVYYSGHGAPNVKSGEPYLVPYDGDPAFVESTTYPLKRLYAALDKLPAKEVVVMLDSCFSGAGGRSVIARGMRPMGLSIENPVLTSGKTLVLTASSGSQVSSTFEEKGHGLLTYFFLKGLKGDSDLNKDGTIELAEMYEYVRPNVERIARNQYNNEQTPRLLASPDVLKKGGGRLVEPRTP